MQDALTQLTQNTEHIHSEKELADKLARGRPLRVKLGVDPTAPDIHLGHAVQLRKLRQFQDLGHQVILIIGNFTAMIGDPSGRTVTRPPLTEEEVAANAKTFTDQAFLVLDREKTEVLYNGDWLSGMTFAEVIRLNARVTMQQMLQREDFKKRLAQNQEVRLHEIQYPIVQGWDSVVIKADVEIGGTDQLFNMLVGRDLQKGEGMEPQIVITSPLLEGLDGNKKMSKSLGNYVALTDPPREMFGKLMSISDEMMPKYYRLAWGRAFDPGLHPMEAKKQLAAGIVELYHSAEAAVAARKHFEDQFGKGDVSEADLPEVDPPAEGTDLLSYVGQLFSQTFDQERSNADIRRLITQGSVRINGEKVADPKASPVLTSGDVVKLDKKRMVRVR